MCNELKNSYSDSNCNYTHHCYVSIDLSRISVWILDSSHDYVTIPPRTPICLVSPIFHVCASIKFTRIQTLNALMEVVGVFRCMKLSQQLSIS